MRSYYHDLVQGLHTSQALLFIDETCSGITLELVHFQLLSLHNQYLLQQQHSTCHAVSKHLHTPSAAVLGL